MHENRRRQRHEATRKETIKSADDDHRSETVHRDQTQAQNARDESAGHDHVHRPHAIGDKVGDDATENRASVQDGQEVGPRVFAGDLGLDGVGLHVEEDDEQAHEAEESAQDEQGVGGLFESWEVEEFAA